MIHVPAILSISFRPFFICAGGIAVFNPIFWVLSYIGEINMDLNHFEPLFWHAHEMMFGFSGALIAGFILTASANWTNTKPYQGRILLLLLFLWLIERISYFLPISECFHLLLLNLFFPSLLIMLYLKLKSFPKQKYVFIPILLGVTLGSFLHSYGHIYSIDSLEGGGKEISIGLIRFIVLLIAGRVIPFFTIKKINTIKIDIPKWINFLSLISVLTLAIPNIKTIPIVFLVIIFIIVCTANILRQLMWKPFQTMKIPILFVLHIGIGFINLSLLLEFLGLFFDKVNITQAPLHMLLAGGLGVVSIGIMTRVALGHTGRDIIADKWTIAAYLLIIIGSLLRVFIPLSFLQFYINTLFLTSVLWGGGFVIFLLRYFKILISQRPDGKEY